jgi:hypothetical protein
MASLPCRRRLALRRRRPNGALHTSPGQRPGNTATCEPSRSEGTPHFKTGNAVRSVALFVPRDRCGVPSERI